LSEIILYFDKQMNIKVDDMFSRVDTDQECDRQTTDDRQTELS